MNINLNKQDIERLGVVSSFNKMKILYLNEGNTHVMKSNLHMVKVTTDAEIPKEFGTSYSKLITLSNLSNVNGNDLTGIEVVEGENRGVNYLKCTTPFNTIQFPTEEKRFLGDYLPKTATAFDDYVQKVKDGEVCEIVASNTNPSLFERFDYNRCGALQIENDFIDIYQDDTTGNINIDISPRSVNEGALPSGAKSKKQQNNDSFVRSIVCKKEDLVGNFPKDTYFTIPTKVYANMQASKRQFNMRMGTFELADRIWLGLHFYSDDIEYFNILESK